MKDTGIDAKWTRPEQIHLTLRFLGDIAPEAAPDILGAMAGAAAGMTAPRLRAAGIGAFPGLRRPQVLWLGIDGDIEPLGMLHGRLEARLAMLGFEPEKRGFTAHITVGRVRRIIPPEKLMAVIASHGGLASAEFAADRLILYKSDLRPSGAVHTPLGDAPIPAGDI